MDFNIHIADWALTQPFRISGFEWINSRCLVVELVDDGFVGRGEAQGVFYLDETAESIFEQAHEAAAEIRRGISCEELQDLLPAGGARNAIDCAMWDLECKRTGKTIWQLTGIEPKPVTTVYTIGLEDSPEAMAAKAAAAAEAPILKVKLSAHKPYEKLAAIRAARPDGDRYQARSHPGAGRLSDPRTRRPSLRGRPPPRPPPARPACRAGLRRRADRPPDPGPAQPHRA